MHPDNQFNYRGLGWAIAIAAVAHGEQRRKDGSLYIHHPLAVMDSMDDEQDKIVAVLHDTLEDTHLTLDEIDEHFGPQIADDVCVLTRGPESYREFIDSICEYGSVRARRVKVADILHNLSTIGSVPNPDEQDYLINRYQKALDRLVRRVDQRVVTRLLRHYFPDCHWMMENPQDWMVWPLFPSTANDLRVCALGDTQP